MLLIATIASLAFAGTAQAAGLYGDSNGEGAPGLPFIDINTVTVSNDPAVDTVSFQISLSAPSLSGTAAVNILIGAGTNPSYAVEANDSGASLVGVDSSGHAGSSRTAVTSTYSGGVLTVTFGTSSIGSPSAFRFSVISIPAYTNHEPFAEDTAPDIGTWSYALTTGSAPAPAPSAPIVAAVSARFSAAGPKHGAAFVSTGLVAQLSDGSTAKATSVSCTAMLGTQALKGTGTGGCTFKLPKTATKKTVVITTSGKVGSETVTSTDSFTVK
jgi:hypothetical protein